MEKINNLAKKIDELSILSEDILKLSIPILRAVYSRDTIIVDRVLAKNSYATAVRVGNLLESIVIELVNDAEQTKDGLEDLVDSIINNTEIDQKTFMGQIWNGDQYDAKGIYALDLLQREMYKTFELFKGDWRDGLVEKVEKRLRR